MKSVRRRVLVVDDNADAAETLAMILELNGHEVRTASSGPMALELAQALQPEVVFLDIGLPGMNGYEVAQHLRAHPGHGPMVLVALTGWGRDQDKDLAKEAGFDHHLTKPMDVEAVETILSKLP